MNKTIKRGLAIAAVAPLAIIGVAGSAAAATERADIIAGEKFFSQVSVRCEHPDESNLDMRVKIDLEGDGLGGDASDTNYVRVTGTDNGGSGTFHDAEVRTKKIKIAGFKDGESVGSVTRSNSDVTSNGNTTFRYDKNNLDYMRAQVWWDNDGEDETAYCLVAFPGFNTSTASNFNP